MAVEMKNREAAVFRETGDLPEGLDPGKLPPEAFRVTPEPERNGYSEMHNTPIDALDRPENIEKYLRRQMDAHVRHHTKRNMGENPAEFGKALLKPELDPELGANWGRFDPANFYYTDDGPINYQEEHHVEFLTPDPTSAREHFMATYGRAVRDALMYKGVADDAYMNRPDLLAMSYARNTLSLRRMAGLAHKAMEGMETGEWERPQMPGYCPVTDWTLGTEENLRKICLATDNMGDLKAFREDAAEMIRSLEGHFDIMDAINHDSPMNIYSFYQHPEDPGNRDIDHPANIMLREAVNDIEMAREFISLARVDEFLNQAREARDQGKLDECLEGLMAEDEMSHETRWVIKDMLREEGQPRYPGRDASPSRSPEDRRTRMVHRAIDRLTHADFCITTAFQANQEPPQ